MNIGDYLLKGWIMLADHCPVCLSPLLQNGRGGEIVCAKCGPQIAGGGDGAADSTVAGSPLIEPSAVENASSSSKSASNELGTLLLRGWVMMNDACPECHIPLMRTKDSSDCVCVECGRHFVFHQGGKPVMAEKDEQTIDDQKTEKTVKFERNVDADDGTTGDIDYTPSEMREHAKKRSHRKYHASHHVGLSLRRLEEKIAALSERLLNENDPESETSILRVLHQCVKTARAMKDLLR